MKRKMRCTAADMADLLLLIFVTLIAFPLSESFAGRSRNPQYPMRVAAAAGSDGESSQEEASGSPGPVGRTHAAPELEAMIGYSPPSAPRDLAQEMEPHQFSEAALDEGGHFSGFGVLRSSAPAPTTAGTASSDIAAATVAPETGPGTDFGLLGVKELTHNATVAHVDVATSTPPWQPKEEEGEETRPTPTSDISPNVGLAETNWDWMTTPPQKPHVVCVDWTQPSGQGYVLLNMMRNLKCEEFRGDGGVRLMKTMERRVARRMNSTEGSWVIYLSKPRHQQRQMLMHVASDDGVMATKDLLSLLGEMRPSLNRVGIQEYGAPPTCQPRRSASQRSDYSKLFVVLVVIGSICLVIITSGFIYICWQRRPPSTKTTFRGEELRFVENGCHDNPTLDVAGDNQPDARPEDQREEELKKKQPSTNGLVGGGEGVCMEENPRWQVFVNQAAAEEEEEEDTHL
ncbi:podocalyxin-like protein 2 isoform X2 [Phyllopteryx taeniolatus]|uniref:podocalyxin-like protein 2 isoform X2 n=1 Tax=Phyllopteryx taeniolatus TaxID=161469 RepID=UPI002AD31390|nr:podocalyxin-like protein 2 isoform X2 [Phyllopteryx taeniolatus]